MKDRLCVFSRPVFILQCQYFILDWIWSSEV